LRCLLGGTQEKRKTDVGEGRVAKSSIWKSACPEGSESPLIERSTKWGAPR